jgi:hypothetical protein
MGGHSPTLGFLITMTMHNAISTALRTVRRVAGGKVTFKRGSQSVELTAAVGSKLHRDDDLVEGTSVRIVTRDYLIGVAELKLDYQLVEPQEGDLIIDGSNQYKVVSAVEGEPCWSYSDTAQSTYRIHTIRDN